MVSCIVAGVACTTGDGGSTGTLIKGERSTDLTSSAHLFTGTESDNMHDMAIKGRARNQWGP
jgi:hypothetical protein